MTASGTHVLSPGAVRRARLADARLYLVTGMRREQRDLAGFLEAVLSAGVDVVQLREKEAEAGDLLRAGAVFKDAADRHGALFIVNDRPDVAFALEADGVHLGQNDLPPAIARTILGAHMLIGVSTHSETEFAGAAVEADYLCAGPVHETPTKPGRPAAGHDLLHAARARTTSGAEPRPWFAIGGVNTETLPAMTTAGAMRVVVVRAIAEAADPANAVRQLLQLLPELP